MIGFDFDKTVTEVLEIIRDNELDSEIRDYFNELLDEDEIIIDPPNYFEIRCKSENGKANGTCVGGILFEEEVKKLSKNELLLHNELGARATAIFDKIKVKEKKQDNYYSKFNKRR